ncbi:MAG: N-acetyltransferase [Candidatus Omnitrophica bacterium]|nr:N-acetyltransferase [Candidatus Omnitrophota bacterium]
MITKAGKNSKVHHTVRAYGRNEVGTHSIILENVCLGYPTTKILLDITEQHLDFTHADFQGCSIGNRAVIRSDAIIYCQVRVGNFVRTGHRVLIREFTSIGNNVMIGTNTVIENNCTIGNHVSMQSNVFIPAETIIEDNVFIGPSATLTNDRYPVRIVKKKYRGPIIKKGASIGANSVILPQITVGEGAIVAANAVVTKNVPKWHLAVGSPAVFQPLDNKLRKKNQII